MSQHILLTGGATPLGMALAERLRATGHRVTPAEGDVREAAVMQAAFAKGPFTALVHLDGLFDAAACAGDPLACHGLHVQGALAMLEEARKHGVPHIVLRGLTMEGATGPLQVSLLAAERFAEVHAALHAQRITLVRLPEDRLVNVPDAAGHFLHLLATDGAPVFTASEGVRPGRTSGVPAE